MVAFIPLYLNLLIKYDIQKNAQITNVQFSGFTQNELAFVTSTLIKK